MCYGLIQLKYLLCNEEGTLNHILSGCKVALSQGRYKWRHDEVLKNIASCNDEKLVENALVDEWRHFRSPRGNSMIPDLALKRVMSLVLALRSESGAKYR